MSCFGVSLPTVRLSANSLFPRVSPHRLRPIPSSDTCHHYISRHHAVKYTPIKACNLQAPTSTWELHGSMNTQHPASDAPLGPDGRRWHKLLQENPILIKLPRQPLSASPGQAGAWQGTLPLSAFRLYWEFLYHEQLVSSGARKSTEGLRLRLCFTL